MKSAQSQKVKKKSAVPRKPSVSIHKTGSEYIFALACALFGFMLYANTIGHGFVLDDQAAITQNLYVQQGIQGIPKLLTVDFWHFSSLRLGYYRPLPLITFALEYQFFGLNPVAGHFNNVLLFALLVFFIFLLVRKLFINYNPLFPFIVAILFAAHPIHSEVINNIKSRDELLSFLNLVIMLWFTVRYAEQRKTGDLAGAMVFFYLALLSKESAVTGILLIPLVIYFNGKRNIREIFFLLLPFLAVIVAWFLQKQLLFETTQTIIPEDIVNYPYNNAEVRLSSLFRLLVFFFQILLFPHPLRYDYSFNQIPAVTWGHPLAWLGLLLFVLKGLFVGREIVKKTDLGLSTGFIIITMIPALGFIFLRGGIFAERLLFAPSFGFCLALVVLFKIIFRVDFTKPVNVNFFKPKGTIITFGILFTLFSFYSIQTYSRNPAWKDPFSLYSTDIQTGSESAQNHLHLGNYYLNSAYAENEKEKKARYIELGKKEMTEALRVLPTFGDALFYMGYVYELKAASQDIRNVDTAIWYYNQAAVHAPAFFEIYIHLGDIYKWMQRYDVASYYFNEAARYNPSNMAALEKAAEIKQKYGLDVRTNPLEK